MMCMRERTCIGLCACVCFYVCACVCVFVRRNEGNRSTVWDKAHCGFGGLRNDCVRMGSADTQIVTENRQNLGSLMDGNFDIQ